MFAKSKVFGSEIGCEMNEISSKIGPGGALGSIFLIFLVLERVVFSIVFGNEKSGSKISKNLTKVIPRGDRGEQAPSGPRPRRGEGGR